MGATANLWITTQVAKDRSWKHPHLVFSIFYTFFPLQSCPPRSWGRLFCWANTGLDWVCSRTRTSKSHRDRVITRKTTFWRKKNVLQSYLK